MAPAPISFLPPDPAAVLHLVRENLRLLADLGAWYETGYLDPAEAGAPPAGTLEAREFVTPGAVADYLGPELAAAPQEQLRALLLTTKHTLIRCVLVTQGTVDASLYRLADVFREAVRANAAALILAHNHPSGDPEPSPEDVRFTADAARAGALLGVRVLDHVVIGRGGPTGAAVRYVSLRTLGRFTPEDGA